MKSKVVVTGDITQVDLSAGEISGLIDVQEILININNIFFFFGFQDVSYDFFYTIFVNRIVFLLVYNFQFHHKLGWVLKDKTQRLLFFTHPLIPSQEGIFIIPLLRGVGVCLSIAYKKG